MVITLSLQISPKVWRQGIHGGETSSPSHSGNLGDVKTNRRSYATHRRPVEKAAKEKERVAGGEREDGGGDDHHDGAHDEGQLATVAVHEEPGQQIANHLHGGVQAD